MDTPRIISVDDHVVEPPDLWTDRLPAKYKDRGPRVERDTAKFHFVGGVFSYEKGVDDGEWCDCWLYDDLVYPFPKLSAAVGFAEPRRHARHLRRDPARLLEAGRAAGRHGRQPRRRVDLLPEHAAALLRPDVPRARRQGARAPVRAGLQRLDDRRVVRRRGQGPADPAHDRAAVGRRARRRRGAPLRRPRAASRSTFPENPYPLGLPSIHDKDRYWEPFFQACQDTDTTSACTSARRRRCRRTSPDAPFIVSSTLTFSNAMGSMCDYIFSGMLERFPTLKLAYSEGQVGWMPYVIERADKLWAERSDNSFGTSLPQPPSSYVPRHLRLHLRRRGRPRQPRRHRHGPDLLRDRLPARRLARSRTRRRSSRTSAPRPA